MTEHSKKAAQNQIGDYFNLISQLESEAVLAAVMETTDDLIAVLDNEKRVIVANGAFRKMFYRFYGVDLKSRDTLLSYLPAEEQKFWQKILQKIYAGDRRRFDQLYFLQKKRYDIEWSNRLIRSKAGDTSGVVLYGRDITRRRMAEETLRERDAQLHHAQKLEAVGMLAGGAVNEFNNTMSIVLGNLELASMDADAEHPVRSYVEDAKAGILNAKKVVRQLLDFSRKSDGKQQKADLQIIAANAMRLLRSTIPTHIEFHELINPCPPVMAEPAHIHQLIINLCTNAAEAMDEDGGVLTMTLEPVHLRPGRIPTGLTLSPGTYAKLTVTDTGPGIEATVVGCNDEPDVATRGANRGTGLGLAIVHGIVERHGGEIIAGHYPGRGSKFEIFLPTVPESKSEQIPVPDPDTLRGNEHILFVDDEAKFVMITQRQLEHLGYKVTVFTSPINALHSFQGSPNDYDLVISDVAMPKMTGEKLIHQIRLVRPDMPAIICTGYSNKIDQQKAELMGCEYVLKPVERNQLAQRVRKVLNQAPPFKKKIRKRSWNLQTGGRENSQKPV